MIVEWFVRLRQAGVDGVQVNFFDFEPDLDYFIATVLPLMQQAALRHAMPQGGGEQPGCSPAARGT